MSVRIVIVRHGERLDESDRQEWHRIRTHANQHDPPLTAAGWDQAKIAGRSVARLVQAAESPATIYSSPTVRTLSTAAAIVGTLRGETKSVMPAYALNCCAAAQTYGVAKAFPKGKPDEDTMRGVSLDCWPPLGDADKVNRRQASGGGFVKAVKELAASHSDGEVLVMVTHREGIWELLQHVGAKMQTGYCNISTFSYDLTSCALTGWDPNSSGAARHASAAPGNGFMTPPRKPKPMSPCASPNHGAGIVFGSSAEQASRGEVLFGNGIHQQPGAQRPGEIALEPETLEAVLKRGSGRVVIHRGGRSPGSTLLWCTPGVRGVWVDGGAVPDGEAVELLSTPVSSEGAEGDFVRVRRGSGCEGWTKVRNVHLWVE